MVSEVFTNALLPYKGTPNAEVWTKVSDGSLFPTCPVATCPQELWGLIAMPTFAKLPADRPTFAALVTVFEAMSATEGTGNAPPTASRLGLSKDFWAPRASNSVRGLGTVGLAGRKSPPWQPRICSRTLMGYSDPP